MTCEELESAITNWVRQEMECADRGQDCFVLTLPLLKPNGDAIELGLEKSNGENWRISDLGETLSTLFLAGVDLFEEYVRAEELRQVKELHKIKESEQELFIEAGFGDLPAAIFDFVHAIQSVLALQLTVVAKPPKRDFDIVVTKFLAEQHTSFEIPAEHIEGKTGRWKFNFVLNTVRKETLVKALTSPSRGYALRLSEQAVFEILDVQEIRGSDAIAILDDEGGRSAFWQPRILRIFEGYKIPVYAFQKNKVELGQLALSFAK